MILIENYFGRVTTFQDSRIGLVFTSYCLTDTNDTATGGATNTQPFGRARGYLGQMYALPGKKLFMGS
jgi:hypothetical protein